MNKIILNKPLLINKRYVVYLDSDNKFDFSNRREAQDFIVDVERVIEEAILFITEEYNSLSEFYRLYYLADKDFKFKFLMSNSISFLINRLEWMNNRNGGLDHNVILFHGVISCIEELKTAFEIMREKAHGRRDIISKRRCALKTHIIEIYHEKLLATGIKPREVQLQLRKAQ